MPFAVDIALLLGACLGHLALMVALHNWFYGLHLPKHTGKVVHLCFGLLILALPYSIVFRSQWQLLDWTVWVGDSLTLSYRVYLTFACVVGYVVFPWITWQRLHRQNPEGVTTTNSRVVDLEEKLGHRPVGPKSSLLSRFPGNQIFQVEFVEKTIASARIPKAWDGVTLLHLSDLHFEDTPDRKFYQEVFARCGAWNPDLLAITGDFVDSRAHHEWIEPLLRELSWKERAFAILGNHDYWYDPLGVRKRYQQAGVTDIGNKWEQFDLRGEPLIVVGQEVPWFGPAPKLDDAPRGPFRLCLAHTPDRIRWAQNNAIDLMLAGHVHGGQIRFPIVGSVVVPSRFGRRFDQGTFLEPPTLLHVSRGLAGEHPIRLNCRPEVTLFTLKPLETDHAG